MTTLHLPHFIKNWFRSHTQKWFLRCKTLLWQALAQPFLAASPYIIFEHHIICQNKRQTSVLSAQFNQCIIFIFMCPDYSEAMEHLGGPSTIFPNSTVCCSDTLKLYTVVSIYPFKEKPMLFGLPFKLECSLAKESFFRKFCMIG